MKKLFPERNIVVLLFLLVLLAFSLAERDSKKLDKLYTRTSGKHTPSYSAALPAKEHKALPITNQRP